MDRIKLSNNTYSGRIAKYNWILFVLIGFKEIDILFPLTFPFLVPLHEFLLYKILPLIIIIILAFLLIIMGIRQRKEFKIDKTKIITKLIGFTILSSFLIFIIYIDFGDKISIALHRQ